MRISETIFRRCLKGDRVVAVWVTEYDSDADLPGGSGKEASGLVIRRSEKNNANPLFIIGSTCGKPTGQFADANSVPHTPNLPGASIGQVIQDCNLLHGLHGLFFTWVRNLRDWRPGRLRRLPFLPR